MINLFKSYLRDYRNYYFKKKNPFGNSILASKEYYLDKHKKAKSLKFKIIDGFEKKCDYSIDKDWLDDLALHTQVVKKESEINYQHGRVLYSCLRKFIYKNNLNNINILETGSARGFSSVCMSKAVNDSKVNGKIISIDIISSDEKIYWNCIDDFEGKKTRTELLSKWKNETKNINFLVGPTRIILKKIEPQRFHFAFLDGMHDYLNVKTEFNFVALKQIKGDIIILDDANIKFPGIIKCIDEIKEKNIYKVEFLDSEHDRSYAICEKL